MKNFVEYANFIWSVADEVLRGELKAGKYRDVILPFTVLRRVECVLEPTKEDVIKRYELIKDKGNIKDPYKALCGASKHSFYNTSPYNLKKLLEDPANLRKNLLSYIDSFSDNMQEILDKFKIRIYIDELDESGSLYLLLSKYSTVDLHPDNLSNNEMGYVFEELIRKFNESMNENPGEHFTPREVIRLMVNLLFYEDKEILGKNHPVRLVYDPACGTGGMLTISKEHILNTINPDADIRLFGQESQPETFAIAKSDMLLKGDDKDAENIKLGSSFSKDGHPYMKFDYMLSNPPYGDDWTKDQKAVLEDDQKRFEVGTPRKSDGQLLFVQHMISKMKLPEDGGSRIAIVMNGSPLFTGDAGSGESEIRRWIIENDWLEAIIALPNQLFYNTGINTYIWIVTNRKEDRRKGKIQLINAVDCYIKMRKSLGNKRNEISEDQIALITKLHTMFEEGEYSKIFENEDFGYRKITIERPLRLKFQVTPERVNALKEQNVFQNLAVCRKRKDITEKEREEAEGRHQQESIISALSKIDPKSIFMSRDGFVDTLDSKLKQHSIKPSSPVKKAIISAMSESDDNAELCKDTKRNIEPDTQLRDFESVPLKEDIYAYFEREVKPHVPDAWIDESVKDHKDNKIGKVGYEINFNRYFYKYEPPRPLEKIEADINKLENEILEMLKEMAE